MVIWSVHDGQALKTFKAAGGVHDVCWNGAGDKVAAVCTDDKMVCVLDLRM